jgi:DNA-binding NtrC family response regulator
LRERREDIKYLYQRFLPPALRSVATTPEDDRELASLPWPGNLRRLRTVAERAVAHGLTKALKMSEPVTPRAPSSSDSASPRAPGAGVPREFIGGAYKEMKAAVLQWWAAAYWAELVARFDGRRKDIAKAAEMSEGNLSKVFPANAG